MSTSESKSITTDNIYEALCITVDFLDSISCTYFLSGGTLLGALREEDIISHDKDFDLDCFEEDRNKILTNAKLLETYQITISEKKSTGLRFSFGRGSKCGVRRVLSLYQI